MVGLYGLMVFAGIVLVVIGIIIYNNPDMEWNWSISRRLYLKGGEPTELYYKHQKASGVVCIIFGIGLILWVIISAVDFSKGYEIKIDNQSISLPCTYSEIEAIGYKIDSKEEIKSLSGSEGNDYSTVSYTVKNDKGKEFEIKLENDSTESKLATDCTVIGIYIKTDKGPVLELPNGAKSTMKQEQIEDIMGKPDQIMSSGKSYKYNENSNFKHFEVIVGYGNTNSITNFNSSNIYNSIYDYDKVSFIRIEKNSLY